ncbi:MAG: hypothetical protein PHX51_06410 [Clostridia bacterium]|nr:hypothetical protein [Clostridia bacterium]
MDYMKHIYATETEIAKDVDLWNTVEAEDLIKDIKALIKEYYTATLTEECNALIIKFNNGQIFKLTLAEEKLEQKTMR